MPPWFSTGSSTAPIQASGGVHTITLPYTVDLARLQSLDKEKYPFLLQSVTGAAAQSRYDILFACPAQTVSLGRIHEPRLFLDELDQLTATTATASEQHGELPFTGGWFVYLGYELAGQIEPRLCLPEAVPAVLPVAYAADIPAAIINNHHSGQAILLARSQCPELVLDLLRDIQHSQAAVLANTPLPASAVIEAPANEYTDSILRILDYIREGDVFQVNLSRQWQVQFQAPVAAYRIYQSLCQHNPAPFAALVHLGDSAILSSSPERLFSVDDGVINTRPIAGTRPRGLQASEDETFSRELMSHPKEQAEHVMLIDLERNDLGRVCVPGSVQVSEFMSLESYAHVHHIVSNVQGRLRQQVTPGQIMRALFPGGTITGCPKVRCMEIIAELERAPRGAYTGSVGYISDNGHMDFNILIRTLSMQGDQIFFRTGAGIVADSDPQREVAETRAKARGLLLALGQTPS